MHGLLIIEQTRKYLDYLEEHLQNVEKAFLLFRKHCHTHWIFEEQHQLKLEWLEADVYCHDLSKFSTQEFQYYRVKFFPTVREKTFDEGIQEEFHKAFQGAWEHHKTNNAHHPATYLKMRANNNPNWELGVIHQAIDLMAMSLKFGGEPSKYLDDHRCVQFKDVPNEAIQILYTILYTIEASYTFPEERKPQKSKD